MTQTHTAIKHEWKPRRHKIAKPEHAMPRIEKPEVEEWRDVPGWGNLYKVSNHGEVYSVRSRLIMKPTKVWTNRAHLMLKVTLTRDGVTKQRSIASLVLEAFVGPKPKGKEVRHLQDNPYLNGVGDVVYGTPLQNQIDALRNGRKGKLAQHQIEQIVAAKGRVSIRALARHFGVGPTTIVYVQHGRVWQHVQIEAVALPPELEALAAKRPARRRFILDAAAVRQIRRLAGTMSQAAIAQRFGVSRRTVRDAVSRRAWKHVE